jgi:deoxyribodipyrimidine photo-lyase
MLVFIHRKDLRITDMPAFDYIRSQKKPSLHILILDPALLKKARHLEHSGVEFLSHVNRLQTLYEQANQKLHVIYGEPVQVLHQLHEKQAITEIVFHADATPYAMHRDRAIHQWASTNAVSVHALQEHMLIDIDAFEQFANRTEPYRVYTPFWRKWREMMSIHATPPRILAFAHIRTSDAPLEWLSSFAVPDEILSQNTKLFHPTDPLEQLTSFIETRLADYETARDDFAKNETSGISKALNCGAISIRQIWHALPHTQSAEPWRRQLAWRDFYYYQAVRDPHFYTYEKKYDFSSLSDQHFKAWATGQTGIPIIDAAMRELNETGHMHNRLRMVTAMFLTKNLLCPFQLGETYFRYKLSDYENTLNRGGWLWSSSIGFDAAPYFRIMNPVLQSERFNPSGDYIRKWVPELAHLSNKAIHQPQPHAIVDLKASRLKAIEVYGNLLKTSQD